MATMLTMTATVKAMDSQRCVCRTHLFQFNGISCEDDPGAHRAQLQVPGNRQDFAAADDGQATAPATPPGPLPASPIVLDMAEQGQSA
jgi:hypothetical protein